MIQQCALTAQTANCILGCTKRRATSRSGRCCCPSALCCEASPGALPAGVESSVQERHKLLESIQRRATKMTPRMEQLFCEDRLRAGAVQMEKGRLRGELRAACQYPMGSDRKEGDSLLSRACGDRIRGNGFKWHCRCSGGAVTIPQCDAPPPGSPCAAQAVGLEGL